MTLRQLARDLRRMFYQIYGYYPCVIDGHKFKCDPWHVGFWWRMADHIWEPETLSIFQKYIKPTDVVFDMGAWIGPTTLYSAVRCKQVFAFEPDPYAYEHLLFNLHSNALNNVVPFNFAISDKNGLESMGSYVVSLGDTTTSLVNKDATKPRITVPTLGWDTFIQMYPHVKPDFIKIDIEGAEFGLISAMKNYLRENRPTLYLSTHQMYFPEGERASLMKTLMDALSFYPEIYTAQMERINPETILAAKEGGVYLFKV